MILSDVRQAVRSSLDDTQYDGTKIDLAINWFQNELFNNTRTALMETSQTLSIPINTSEVALPTDLQVLLDLTVLTPRVFSIWNYRLPQQTFDLQYPNYTGYTSREIYAWTTYGRKIIVSAPVSAATTLRASYVRRPTYATGDTTVLEAPDQYFELYVLGAQARIMEINEDFAEAAQIRNNLEPLVTTFIRNEGRGGIKAGPTIIRTNRRRQGGGFGDPQAGFY